MNISCIQTLTWISTELGNIHSYTGKKKLQLEILFYQGWSSVIFWLKGHFN